MTSILFAVLAAVALDRLFPDRAGVRPLHWFRDWAESSEERFNGGKRRHGVAACAFILIPVLAIVLLARWIAGEVAWVLRFAFDVGVLWFCFDLHRLGRSATDVAHGLEEDRLDEANASMATLGGRPVAPVTEAGIARSSVEMILEQGNSSVISPLFWFVVFGPAGAVVERVAALLDTVWVLRDRRASEFGWAAARLHALISWLPARVTALSYALMGNFEDAMECWRRLAYGVADRNRGVLMASGLGALHLMACDGGGGGGEYGEEDLDGPMPALADASHVRRAIALVWRVLLLWLVIGILMSGAHLVGFFGG